MLGAAGTAAAKQSAASGCRAPDSGFRTCLRVLYTPMDDGTVEDARAFATLVRRVAQCPARSGRRSVVITLADGSRLDSARRPGRCRKGVQSWRATFSPGETASWELREGDTVHAGWTGVRNGAAVKIGR